MATRKKCNSCQYYDDQSGVVSRSTGAGFCKCKSPIAVPTTAPAGEVSATWPTVEGTAFACGEYVAGSYSSYIGGP